VFLLLAVAASVVLIRAGTLSGSEFQNV